MIKSVLLLMITNSIITQATTAAGNDTTARNRQASAVKRGNLQPRNYLNSTAVRTNTVSASNRTSGPSANVTKWLPRTLPVWPSVLPQLMLISSNVLALNPSLDNTTFYKQELRPKSITRSTSATPLKDAVVQILRVLTNVRDFKDPLIYNATLMMNSVPSYLGVQFDAFSAGLRQVISDMVVAQSSVNEMDKDMVSDVKYLITKGLDQVNIWNSTLTASNFFTQRLPMIMNVSQTYPAMMDRAIAGLGNTRKSLGEALAQHRLRIRQRYDALWNETVSVTREVQNDLNLTEASINQFVGAIRTRNPQHFEVFNLQFNATCNPSFDLLDAAERHLTGHVAGLPLRADRLIDEAVITLDNVYSEVRSQMMGVEFELRKGYDCVTSINTAHGTPVRNLRDAYLIAANPLKASLQSAFDSAIALAVTTSTEVVARMTELKTLASAADSITSTVAFGTFSESATNLLNELAMALLGRASVQIMKIPLSLGGVSLEPVVFGSTYNAYLATPATPFARRVVPTLADGVDNSALIDFGIPLGSISIPLFATYDGNYAASDVTSTVSNSGVLLPMCYPTGFVTENFAPSVVPHTSGSFAVDVLIDNMNLTLAPEVSVSVFIDDFRNIQPVSFVPNPRQLFGLFPARDFNDRQNGAFNFVRATSIRATPGGVTVSIQVSDITQFSTMLRRENAGHFLRVSVFADEKPFA